MAPPIRKVIITCPHGKCHDTVNRDCDRRAREMALRIHGVIAPKYDTTLHVREAPRAVLDCNRVESRDCAWRRAITRDLHDSIAKYGVESVLLIDAHSLTGYMPEFTVGGVIPAIAVISWDPRATILQQRLAMALGKPVWGFWATSRADIITEACELGVAAILIEHNEKHTQLTEGDVARELEVICELIPEWHEVNPVGTLHIKQPGDDEFVLFPGTQPISLRYLPFVLFLVVVMVVTTAMLVDAYAEGTHTSHLDKKMPLNI